MKHDLQEAWRFLRANRAFAAVVILTLGLAQQKFAADSTGPAAAAPGGPALSEYFDFGK